MLSCRDERASRFFAMRSCALTNRNTITTAKMVIPRTKAIQIRKARIGSSENAASADESKGPEFTTPPL